MRSYNERSVLGEVLGLVFPGVLLGDLVGRLVRWLLGVSASEEHEGTDGVCVHLYL